LLSDKFDILKLSEVRKAVKQGEDKALYMKTLGKFSISWNGIVFVGGKTSGESQFTCLMQILLHAGDKGVTRAALEEALFDGREVANIRHATQSVIYNAKRRLRQIGLPEAKYIDQRDGIFYWTGAVPVIEDARELERVYYEADKAVDLDDKLALYLDVCKRYTGEFLPNMSGMIWASHEARRYQEMFYNSMENAVTLLRINDDFARMEELGKHASRVEPLANWELVTMEALIAQEKYAEAKKLYDDTVNYYMQEQGVRPSRNMMDLLDKLGSQMQHGHELLDAIQNDLKSGGAIPGGFVVTYPIFQGVYRMLERMMERGGQTVYLMLCTIVDGKGNPMREGPMLDELTQRLGDAIKYSVRHGDAITQYGKGQYLVLLINTTRENCSIIQKRINYHFIIGRQRTGIQYYVNSVVSPY
jgi:DNA-binding SARP family transcriptional activator